MQVKANTLFWRNISYGAPAFALGMPTLPLLIYLPAIYAEQIGLGLTVTGVAIFIARLFDIITDPIIGILSDKTDGYIPKKWGRRKPLILLGGILGVVGTIFLLNPETGASAFYLTIWTTVLYLGWTMISIPYLAWGADLSDNYDERTNITSVREFFMLAGIMLAGAIPALASTNGYDEQQSMSLIGWVMIGFGLVLFCVLLFGVKETTIPKFHKKEKPLSAIKGIFGNRSFRLLVVVWTINGIANGIPAALFILYLKYALKADELERGLLTFAYFLAAVLGIPLWLKLSKNFDKHKVWIMAMGLACLAFSCVPWLKSGDTFAFLVITIITGMTLGADMILPPSMQADVAEYELLRTGHDRTGLLFSFWSMATKLALALSILIAFPLLEIYGFSVNGGENTNNIRALSVIYSIVPVVLKLLSILIIWHHPLTEKKQSVIKRQLLRLEMRIKRNVSE
jgi:Na+/melibiose symporter-like transporter